jgi:hypothetical protein
VRDARQNGDAATLHAQVHQANAIAELDVEELARGAEQADALYAAGHKEIDQVERGRKIRLVPLPAVRRDGGRANSREPVHMRRRVI